MHQPPRSNLHGGFGAVRDSSPGTFGTPEPPTVPGPDLRSTSQPPPPNFTTFLPPPLDQGSTKKSAPIFGTTSPLGGTSAFGITPGLNSTTPASSGSSALPASSKSSSTPTSGLGHATLDFTSLLAPALASTVNPASSAGKPSGSTAGSTCTQAASRSFDRSTWWQNAVAQSCNPLAPSAIWRHEIPHAYRSYYHSDELIETRQMRLVEPLLIAQRCRMVKDMAYTLEENIKWKLLSCHYRCRPRPDCSTAARGVRRSAHATSADPLRIAATRSAATRSNVGRRGGISKRR